LIPFSTHLSFLWTVPLWNMQPDDPNGSIFKSVEKGPSVIPYLKTLFFLLCAVFSVFAKKIKK
jgi:hypothetical protein